MRIFSVLIIIISLTNNILAQDCYNKLRQTGIDSYNSADYKDAIKKWNGAKECSNLPATNDLDTWISKAETQQKCKNSREVAEKAYKSKDYDTAINLWKDVISKCGDITNTTDLQTRISEANQAKECGKWKEEGHTSFDKKQNEAARSLWTKAFNCPNISETEKKELEVLIKKTLSVDTIYQFNQVDKKPQFDDAIIFKKSVSNWIESNIRHPNLESEEETGGIVDVGFVINTDGTISDAKIIKGLNAACDSEAIRLIRIMPKWDKAGFQNKKAVKVQHELGIEFININKTYSLDEVDRKPSSGNESWITTNLNYPPSARQNRTEGTVLLDFLVDKDGSISDIKIRQALGNGCSQEATRLLQNMPNWYSGRKKGQKVKVLYTSYPVNFALTSPTGTTTSTSSVSTPYKFVIKPIEIKPIAMDDGKCCKSLTNPLGKVDQKGDIYGQVSMRIGGASNASNASTFTFWNIPRGQHQLMRQGISYPLSQSLNRTITILSSDLNTAQFILMAGGTNNGVQNGIFDFDSDDAHEVFNGTPPTTTINFSEVKRNGTLTKTHTFTTGSGNNVVQFTYQIEYIR